MLARKAVLTLALTLIAFASGAGELTDGYDFTLTWPAPGALPGDAPVPTTDSFPITFGRGPDFGIYAVEESFRVNVDFEPEHFFFDPPDTSYVFFELSTGSGQINAMDLGTFTIDFSGLFFGQSPGDDVSSVWALSSVSVSDTDVPLDDSGPITGGLGLLPNSFSLTFNDFKIPDASDVAGELGYAPETINFYVELHLSDVSGGGGPDPTAPVPEPASMALLGMGLAGMALRRRRQSRA